MSTLHTSEGTWIGFRTASTSDYTVEERYFYTNDNKSISLENKPYFNKNTDGATIWKGFETKRGSEVPMSDKEIIYIELRYHIANYFGDKSGRHFRTKHYVLIDNSIFQQISFGEVKEVAKRSKELKGILSELA